jgi:hypothetical protein
VSLGRDRLTRWRWDVASARPAFASVIGLGAGSGCDAAIIAQQGWNADNEPPFTRFVQIRPHVLPEGSRKVAVPHGDLPGQVCSNPRTYGVWHDDKVVMPRRPVMPTPNSHLGVFGRFRLGVRHRPLGDCMAITNSGCPWKSFLSRALTVPLRDMRLTSWDRFYACVIINSL